MLKMAERFGLGGLGRGPKIELRDCQVPLAFLRSTLSSAQISLDGIKIAPPGGSDTIQIDARGRAAIDSGGVSVAGGLTARAAGEVLMDMKDGDKGSNYRLGWQKVGEVLENMMNGRPLSIPIKKPPPPVKPVELPKMERVEL